jgi:lysophospholipase L1-like esterase
MGSLAQSHDTPVRYFWQPRAAGWDPAIIDRLPSGVTSLADVFDGHQQQLYIDEVHTNEAGARILARALWHQLGSGLHASAR